MDGLGQDEEVIGQESVVIGEECRSGPVIFFTQSPISIVQSLFMFASIRVHSRFKNF